jgi:antitoxin VapB
MLPPRECSAGTQSSTIAKLFVIDGDQAVRLPKEFWFDGDEVRVRRWGQGVVLEPLMPTCWPAGYWAGMPRIEHAEWIR